MTMTSIGAPKPILPELPRIAERISFLYLEKCKITRTDSGLSAFDDKGEIKIPLATFSVLLLGPGTSISHRAMELISGCGTMLCWVSENGLKCFATGSPLTNSSRMAEIQASAVSNTRKRLAIARKMYQIRFPDEDVSHLTMQQLRGREGSRIRSTYIREQKRTGVEWNGRSYKVNDLSTSNAVNASLSIANSCLYGIAYAAICSLGCIPSLGFIHAGHQRSFVYDIADLYKTETSIPVAFDIAATYTDNVWAYTRREMHRMIYEHHILERVVHDIKWLLDSCGPSDDDTDILALWDTSGLRVEQGKQYCGERDNDNRYPIQMSEEPERRFI